MSWRLIVDSAARGAWNMAVDEALAESAQDPTAQPTLRLYRWLPPCLSLGFAQPVAAADASFCAAHGIDLVRRPTGGRAVLHHLELTYSVCAHLENGLFSFDLQATYQTICRALVAGLRALGVPAALSGTPEGGYVRPTEAIPCFIGPAAGEVVVDGRKLVGSAMRRIGNAILQHGAILKGWDGALQAGSLGIRDDRSLRPAVVTLADVLGAPPQDAALHDALEQGFSTVFATSLQPSSLTASETARAELLERERYAHQRWTVDRDPRLPA
jgi:lipoyl(octanoyl) transferase